MQEQDMLCSLAHENDIQNEAKCDCNDYATPKVELKNDIHEAEMAVAKRDFNQIQGAEDGSLTVHHAKGGKGDCRAIA